MIPQFALRLIAGMSLTWCLLPRPLITSGFFRIQMLVTLGLGVLVALTSGHWEAPGWGSAVLRWVGGAVALISFAGSVLWTLERRRGGAIAAALVALSSLAALVVLPPSTAEELIPTLLRAIDAVSAGWLLGGLTGAMLLGHWYLTATGMPLVPLQRATQLASAAVMLRLLVAATGVTLASSEMRESLLDQQLVWSILRWTGGLVGPLVLVLTVPGILKYRNTQSATGVLFAAVVLAFIGEAAALLLRRELHWPL